MNDVINLQELKAAAEVALANGLEYVAKNRIYSVWTEKETGWQELWMQRLYSGLYATADAITVLVYDAKRYESIIRDAVEELKFPFDDTINYDDNEGDDAAVKKRKERCRMLLEQNRHTTLKAIHFLRAYHTLVENHISYPPEFSSKRFVEDAVKQVRAAYNTVKGTFRPAKGNSNVSMLTTMQAFPLMENILKSSPQEIQTTKKVFIDSLSVYLKKYRPHSFVTDDKFAEYDTKSNFIIALCALSQYLGQLTFDEKRVLTDAFFLSMSDRDIRNGFPIKDSYTVPETTLSWDTYSCDSKILYVNAVLRLICAGVIPPYILEYFLDDLEDVIDTVTKKKQYLSWDRAPSFSHNIRGLMLLKTLISCLEDLEEDSIDVTAVKLSTKAFNTAYRAVNPQSIVLFMPFEKEHTNDFRHSVQQVLEIADYQVWCAYNDPYDVSVMDSIWNNVNQAQMVIINCDGGGANVMYEAGLAHGLGKHVLLCASKPEDVPFRSEGYFDVCPYNPDGTVNPPPYRDLQRGILSFIRKYISEFCLIPCRRKEILNKLKKFEEEIK